ncbi:hypothetical protein Tco_1270858 [Tanacetum coccineum]
MPNTLATGDEIVSNKHLAREKSVLNAYLERCVWLPGYTSALQIADVFGFAWFHMILLGYTSAIADVFGSAWFQMILPGYTPALQIADVFGCLVTCLLYKLQMC